MTQGPKEMRNRLMLAAALLLAGAASAQAKSGGGILPGASATDNLTIDAAKVDYFDKERKAIYSGSVIVVNGPTTLKASRMTVFLDKKSGDDNSQTGKVKHIDADGPVTMVSKDQTATGDRGSYDRAADKVLLIGNVTLSQGQDVTKGEQLIYDLTTGHAELTGPSRVHGVFAPKNK